MRLKFGFSPCPNDTFMFEPLVNKRIDLRGYEFEFLLEDVEFLNKAALKHDLDVTKLSFNAFTKLSTTYQLLNSGSALGNNCGPLLIAPQTYRLEEVKNLKIAIPGYNTTAYLLLKYAFPDVSNFEEMLFSDIESAVLSGQADAGLLIHENRFTYSQKGLKKIIDLGEYWEKHTGSPIPLGGIAIKRALPDVVKRDIDQILFESISYAFEHPQSGWDFIKHHAQEMSTDVMKSHIELYVNQESQRISQYGKDAIYTLFETVHIPVDKSHLFVSD